MNASATNSDNGLVRLPLLPTQRKLLSALKSRYETGIDIIANIGSVRGGKGVGAAFAVIQAALHSFLDGATAATNQYILAGYTQSSFINNNGDYLYEVAARMGLGLTYRQSAVGRGPHYILTYKRNPIARLFIFGGDKANSWQRVRGIRARAAWLDEATLIDEEFYKLVLTRYDYTGAFTLLTSNAGNPVHWVKASVIDAGGDNVLELITPKDENVYLPDEQRERMDRFDPNSVMARRYLNNEWAPDEGLIIPIPDTALVNEPYAPRGVVFVDPATARRTGALLFVRRQDYWLVADEYVHDGDKMGELTPDERLDAIIHGKGWQVDKMIIDPEDATFRLAARRRGLRTALAKNDWDPGIQTTNNVLQEGLLKINAHCSFLRLEASAWRWNERERQPEPGKHDLLDCLRYGAFEMYPTRYAIFPR